MNSRHRKFLEDFGAKVFELRQSKGWTLAEFAQRASISPSFLGEIERGRRDLSIHIAQRISTALEVPLRNLLGAPRGPRTRAGKAIARALSQSDPKIAAFVLRIIALVRQSLKRQHAEESAPRLGTKSKTRPNPKRQQAESPPSGK